MTIDWLHFTPWMSLAGGLLIGSAAALFMLLKGRLLGVSGILGELLPARRGDAGWRIAFLLGLAVAPVTFMMIAPAGLPVTPRIDAGLGALVAAGLLVGFGTRYGSGCTSGHGVCGISRLSPRSLVATAAFMGTGFLTVYLLRHV